MLLILYVTKKGGIVSSNSPGRHKKKTDKQKIANLNAMDKKTPRHLRIQNGYGSNINFPLTWQDHWTNGDNLFYHLFNSTVHSFLRRFTSNMVSTSGSTLWFHRGFGAPSSKFRWHLGRAMEWSTVFHGTEIFVKYTVTLFMTLVYKHQMDW